MQSDLQALYANRHDGVRATFATLAEARHFYRNYVEFATRYIRPNSRVLDVGCGNGWSSYLFSELGHQVVGIDLNANGFEPPTHPNLELRVGSALEIPLADGSVDAIATYQCLEHVPDPAQALKEIRRVLRPQGTLVVVGPNLLSLGAPIRGMFYYSWQGPAVRALVRFADTPRHPAGNTVPENIYCFLSTAASLLRLSCTSGFQFRMREPDTRPPFHSDSDACWLTNPIEMTRALESLGFEILARDAPRRPGFLRHMASGMYIAAQRR